LDPVFDLATKQGTSMPSIFPYPELHIGLIRGRKERRASLCLGEKNTNKKNDLRGQVEELSYVYL